MGISERNQKLIEVKKNAIIDGMEKALQFKSYDKLTIDDVAKEAEYSKKTIYSYFTSKDEIYFELLIQKFNLLYDNLRNTIAGSEKRGIDKIMLLGWSYYRFAKNHPEYMQDIIDFEAKKSTGNSGMDIILERFNKETGKSFLLLEEAIEEGIEDNTITAGTDIASTAILLWASVNGFISLAYKKKEYIKSVCGKTMDELFDDCMKMIILILNQ